MVLNDLRYGIKRDLMGKCRICGYEWLVSEALGVCINCIRNRRDEALNIVRGNSVHGG